MRNRRFLPSTVILWAILLVLGGCSPFGAGTRHQTDNYVLNSLFSEETPQPPMADLSDIGVLVGPIRMALYLDRSDVVIRNSRNEVEIAEFASWAGPLRENFSRVLAENLSLWLNTKKVAIFPGTRLRLFDYSVHMNVTRFDGRPGEKTHLRARWAITDRKREALFNEHTVLSRPTEDDSIASMVASQSLLLEDISREIAQAIIDLEAKKPSK
jgi:uncharacterized lipoprotein YmbA